MLKAILREYAWIHLAIGVLGHIQFFVGSILFLERFRQLKPVGVWMFIIGSGMMLLARLADVGVKLLPDDETGGSDSDRG